ncbi:preprotein translocase subunit SecE [Lactococcus petauri]|uniref:preprotein translocase subunit SecE n=1 Tax=Lactococcus petauri TaxID=1940789 RepID=UPI00385468B6
MIFRYKLILFILSNDYFFVIKIKERMILFLINHSLHKTKTITWLSFKETLIKTITIILVAIFFALFLGAISWILQKSFNNLLL